jgi:hypothetical protein
MNRFYSSPSSSRSAIIPLVGTGSAFLALVSLGIALTNTAAVMM